MSMDKNSSSLLLPVANLAALPETKFIEILGPIYEKSSWVVSLTFPYVHTHTYWWYIYTTIYTTITYILPYIYCHATTDINILTQLAQAERFFQTKKEEDFKSSTNLASALKSIVDSASNEERIALINAHPDLAGKAAIAGEVTNESLKEQVRCCDLKLCACYFILQVDESSIHKTNVH